MLMVAGDGIGQHYTPFGIPASGIVLNPGLQLSAELVGLERRQRMAFLCNSPRPSLQAAFIRSYYDLFSEPSGRTLASHNCALKKSRSFLPCRVPDLPSELPPLKVSIGEVDSAISSRHARLISRGSKRRPS